MVRLTVSRALVGLLLLLSPTVEASQDHAVCDHIKTQLNNGTVQPTSDVYEALSTENWSQTVWAKPSCIIQPSNADELSYVVSTVADWKVNFAIRSGGHSVVPGAANINRGVLIDLVHFNSVEYDAEKKVVTVGSGLRWKEVYTALDQYNVTVAGGRVLDVGVGGLTLGGGLSYLTDLYGLVCDNVVNYEIVTSTGAIVNANAESNPDLFWALKGGLNNFGKIHKHRYLFYNKEPSLLTHE
ncbi:hypothetical protein PC116_g30736 [Phytophthora cactorum]|nr:hypothetical protein PC116_g30736 [Phytophthora cactorum]